MTVEFNIPYVPENSILGLSYSGMHDSAIAIVSSAGETIFAVSLERISRIKQDGRYPKLLLNQVPWEKIDKIALSVEQSYQCDITKESIYHPSPLDKYNYVDRAHNDPFYQHLKSLNKDLYFVPHHLSHASSAFWLSDFDNALCFVYDGGMANEEWFGGLYQASRTENIQPIDQFGAQRYANVTHVYTAVTAVLGFSPLKHEGKITGLAAYGKDNKHCDTILTRWLLEPRYLDNLLYWEHMYSAVDTPRLKASLKKIAQLKQELGDVSREDLAFSVQKLAEHHVLEILINWQKDTGEGFNNICLSGGLFANVKINQRVSELGFKNVFVSPPMSDDGTALGAALQIASEGKDFSPKRVDHVFLGPVSSSAEIDGLIKEKGVHTLKLDETQSASDTIAKLLNDGAIVAVYQGCSEFGPRALGNRSILANANDPDINRSLNERLNRTDFMPFAPMCLKDDAHLYFEDVEKVEHAAQFMTVTLNCSEKMKQLCPAVVHCDNTARPQLVTQTANPFIFDVLTTYKAMSGKPAIVNTSFNVHEEPIICSAEDALKGFFESGLDYLYIQGHIISLKDNKLLENQYLKKKISNMRYQINTHKKSISTHYDEISSAHNEIKEQKELIDIRDQEKNQLLFEKDQLLFEKDQLFHEREMLSLKNKKINQDLDESIRNNQLLNQKVIDRDHTISDILNSTSWKITTPLRAIFSLFK
ncbi:carbamoyltransferase C-terminal domain-containing protein [Marinomonas sp. 2405UD68-3]|uniref:carbamoyltransferase C-terminal domain-containing protein n=1 Tax=Marinomonas sp. 2405UD68-3 TaxID=3391835 RepID=UPI0039C98C6E